ncbi:dTDP-4-dehydrorhamnose reductase [Stutzerimonas stutzeri]|uniref:dTDP-4-dehydrorhamnose reductase n=1 Tax=Stutzerimonas stutzeri TaxID=316 RepID=A0A2S4AHH4_STUST|nr:dTDP-4-dehydrorhamnose reductase [Stutzerimonas stutzeri]MCQ4265180.1 dTDP-4-dehydrorhamnose reductase [Stutzerimonas stutzeri]POH80879.1 dTDP-4-dehydrorhamnose reductase [Stutzerimonas stutzeri]
MRILVCGAGGQVGRELVERAADFGLEVLAPARAQLDVSKPEQVAAAMRQRPGLIINAAAYTHVDNAESHSDQAYAVNRDGPRYLAEAAKGAGIPLFHISTDYVFSGEANRPYSEDDDTGPTGVYGASKLEGEEAIRSCLPAHLILRTSWVYGVHGHNFVKTMLRLAQQRDALGVVSDQIGCPTQAGSIARVLLELARRYAAEGELAWGVYHYSGAPACSWYDFAVEIFRQGADVGLLARQPKVSPIATAQYPTPARRPAWSVLDCSRFQKTFGLAPHDWQDDLAEVLAILHQQERPAVARGRSSRA